MVPHSIKLHQVWWRRIIKESSMNKHSYITIMYQNQNLITNVNRRLHIIIQKFKCNSFIKTGSQLDANLIDRNTPNDDYFHTSIFEILVQ